MNAKKNFTKKSALKFLTERAEFDKKERMYVKLIDGEVPKHTKLHALSAVFSQSYHHDEKLAAIALYSDEIKTAVETVRAYTRPEQLWVDDYPDKKLNEPFPHNKLKDIHREIGNICLNSNRHMLEKSDNDKGKYLEETKQMADFTVKEMPSYIDDANFSSAEKVLKQAAYIGELTQFEQDAKSCYNNRLNFLSEKQEPSFYYQLANDIMFADIDAKKEKDFNWIRQRVIVFGDVANNDFFEATVKNNKDKKEQLDLETIASKRVSFSTHSINNENLVAGASNFHNKLKEDIRNVQSTYFNKEIQDKANYHFTDNSVYSKRDGVRWMLEWKPAYASALAYMGAAIEIETQKASNKAYETLKQELNWE